MEKIPTYNQEKAVPVEKDGYSVFVTGGKPFRILQLTDLHFGCGFLSVKKDKLARKAVTELITRTKPDLIVVTGDIGYPICIFSGTQNNKRQAKYAAELFESFGIPWTITFGNHDSEPFTVWTREQLCEYYSAQPHCLLKRGDKTVYGVGNHMITLSSDGEKTDMALMMLDSNMYLGKTFFSGCDNIHDDQIEWYKKTVSALGTPLVPSLAFFHMPPKEYKIAWEKLKLGHTDEVTYHLGTINEINDHVGYSKKKEGRFFDEMVAFGSCKGCFCGHDHLNNISMTYRGIRLTYGMAIDYLAYAGIQKKTTNRGGTLITVTGSDFTVELVPLTRVVED